MRSALELDDGSTTRIDKLYRIIEESKFGIHDLSRTESDRQSGLPRFNMPLELGLFLGAKRYGEQIHKNKRALILDVEQYRYQKFVSDLAGMDIHEHQGRPEKAMKEVRNWLANASHRKLPSPAECTSVYARFQNDLPEVCRVNKFDLDDIAYTDFQNIIVAWLRPQ